MPRYPEVQCAGLCGRKIWAGTGSLPEGQAMCRECRRVKRESGVPGFDVEALRRLVPYVNDAIAAQPPHIADQLQAALPLSCFEWIHWVTPQRPRIGTTTRIAADIRLSAARTTPGR